LMHVVARCALSRNAYLAARLYFPMICVLFSERHISACAAWPQRISPSQ